MCKCLVTLEITFSWIFLATNITFMTPCASLSPSSTFRLTVLGIVVSADGWLVAERHVTDLTLDARWPFLKADKFASQYKALNTWAKLRRFNMRAPLPRTFRNTYALIQIFCTIRTNAIASYHNNYDVQSIITCEKGSAIKSDLRAETRSKYLITFLFIDSCAILNSYPVE